MRHRVDLLEIQLHLISFGTFAGQDVFALKIAVHHDDRGLVIVQFPDDCRDLFDPGQLARAFSSVTGHDLKSSVVHGTHDNGHQHPVFPDAFHGFLHTVIVHHTKRVILEGNEIGKRKLLDALIAALTGFLRREDTIE